MDTAMNYVIPFQDIRLSTRHLVGAKNASLGEMMHALSSDGIKIPDGFALTTQAYIDFIDSYPTVKLLIEKLTTSSSDIAELSAMCADISHLIENYRFPSNIELQLKSAYARFEEIYGKDCAVAVRSSASAEDLPNASFTGQQESFLNVSGYENLYSAALKAYASLFSLRAVSYRNQKGFSHHDVALSLGIQRMVRSDLASSGVIFTLDTETGCRDVLLITSSYGLGESLVKGGVNPDEWYIHKATFEKGFRSLLKKRLGSKEHMTIYSHHSDVCSFTEIKAVPEHMRGIFSLSDDEVLELGRAALAIEKYYSSLDDGFSSAMDIEWAKDGVDGFFYILQARPETVHHNKKSALGTIEEFHIDEADKLKTTVVVSGISVGTKSVSGVACVVSSLQDLASFKSGDILVTDMTDPDWVPLMKQASAIITNRGGRTCHAAIVSRELGIPALIGCGNATRVISSGDQLTVDCSSSDNGSVLRGILPITLKQYRPALTSALATSLMVNVGNPDEAFRLASLPCDGVGLARLEFIINHSIRIHPMALVNFSAVKRKEDRDYIEKATANYSDKKQFFIDTLACEAGTIAAAFYPRPVIIRLSDFKSNEYRQLIGGDQFEVFEENPMIGFRGASRYYHPLYKEAFALECASLKKMRSEMGLNNIKIMVPFVRSIAEAARVIDELALNGLRRGKDGLEIIMMCEIPSNVILIDRFSDYFDGFSIGSNDLTQTVLAIDRDSELLASHFNERDEAVKTCIRLAIEGARRNKKPISICGQAPSDYFDFTDFLITCGITSISLNPDSFLRVAEYLALSSK